MTVAYVEPCCLWTGTQVRPKNLKRCLRYTHKEALGVFTYSTNIYYTPRHCTGSWENRNVFCHQGTLSSEDNINKHFAQCLVLYHEFF